MRFRAFASLIAPLLAAGAVAGPADARPPKPEPAARAPEPPAEEAAPAHAPKLVVAIAVDQFSADLFAQYRQHYTGGFAKLLSGAVFPSAFQSHSGTETCPGHSTMLTGVHPSRNGIIANNWFDPDSPRPDKQIYCVEDENDPASSAKNPVVSPRHLLVPTLGEYVKKAYPGSRNVAVSAKDRTVVMMGGHAIDEGYWYLGGQFTTFKGKTLSPAAQAENEAIGKVIHDGAPPYDSPEWCGPRTMPLNVGEAGTIGIYRYALGPDLPDSFRVSPRMDAATLDLATRLVDQDKLGQGPATDVLSVSLSATDYIGHGYGPQGLEMCIQQAELDRNLGAFFEHLDKLGIDYVVELTADHGGIDAPERLQIQGYPQAQRADAALSPQVLGDALAKQLGITDKGPLLFGEGVSGDIYISHALSREQHDQVLAALVQKLKAHKQVEAVFTAPEIAAIPVAQGNPQDWSILQRVRASYYPGRSGDLVVVLKRGVQTTPVPKSGGVTGHGTVWDYDRRVPLLFWRKGLAGFEQPAPVETVDIAPSLAAVLGLKLPAGTFDGRCLDIDGGPDDSCAAQ